MVKGYSQLAHTPSSGLRDYTGDLESEIARLSQLRKTVYLPIFNRSRQGVKGGGKTRQASRLSAITSVITAPFSSGALWIVSIGSAVLGVAGGYSAESDIKRRKRDFSFDYDNLSRLDRVLRECALALDWVDYIIDWRIANDDPDGVPPPPPPEWYEARPAP